MVAGCACVVIIRLPRAPLSQASEVYEHPHGVVRKWLQVGGHLLEVRQPLWAMAATLGNASCRETPLRAVARKRGVCDRGGMGGCLRRSPLRSLAPTLLRYLRLARLISALHVQIIPPARAVSVDSTVGSRTPHPLEHTRLLAHSQTGQTAGPPATGRLSLGVLTRQQDAVRRPATTTSRGSRQIEWRAAIISECRMRRVCKCLWPHRSR
jgi:hypothetical protein